MNNQLVVTPRTVFGRRLYYPANAQARLIAKIASTDTLTLEAINTAREMGFEVSIKHEDDDLFSTADTARKVC